ncbi:MAG: hypothetical protein D6706_14335 [Chloroflexi bacterium]|nr:MAG: hypothetical protein D6706_14335 [Chloroflexota bacterium]
MEELQLRLLGGVQISLGESALDKQLSTKAQLLLSYLVMTGRPQARAVVAGLLWGDKPESDALRSLRVELTKMRQAGLSDYLEVTRKTIGFNQNAPYWLDVEAFENFLKQAALAEGAAARSHLREAVALYQGDFFAGFDVPDGAIYDEWVLVERERLRVMALDALEELVQICLEQESYEEGISFARQLLALDNWREEAHRHLMLMLALNGQRSAALVQYEICRETMVRELGVEPSAETEALYLRIRDDAEWGKRVQTRPFPPLPVVTEEEAWETPFQVPPATPFFVGREKEIAFIRQCVTDEETRLLCLVGMGGVGKSALAIHAAYALRELFPDGVLWANVAGTDPMGIAAKWAGAYGYNFSGLRDTNERFAALRAMLAEKQALLIFDDVQEVARIRPLLPQKGNCFTLLTTRNADLAFILGASVFNLDVLPPENTLLLLKKIIGKARVLNEPEAAYEICQLLGNLPLAIAIAAQRLASRPRRRLSDFVTRLRAETSRLDLGVADREVRASFAISWSALDQIQQHIFRLLAVFEGRSFTADVVAAIADMDYYQTQDRLDALVALSLLHEAEDRRYRQHSLLAAFAAEKLQEDTIPYRRMVQYYLGFASDNRHNYKQLQPEWPNLEASIQWAHKLGMWQTVVDYARILKDAWFVQGRFTEARHSFAWVDKAAQYLQDERLQAYNLLDWGEACLEQGDFAEARTHFEAAKSLCEARNDEEGLARAYYDLGRVSLGVGDFNEAFAHLRTSGQKRQAMDDGAGVADVLYQLARLAYHKGDYKEARTQIELAYKTYREFDVQAGMMRSLRVLSQVLTRLEAYDAAEACYEQAIGLAHRLQDQGELSMLFLTRASLCTQQNNLEMALEYAQKSLLLCKRLGDRRSQAQALFQLSRINMLMGRFEEAFGLGQQCLDLCRGVQDVLGEAFALCQIGDALYQLGQKEEATDCWQKAKALVAEVQNRKLEQDLLDRLNGKFSFGEKRPPEGK